MSDSCVYYTAVKSQWKYLLTLQVSILLALPLFTQQYTSGVPSSSLCQGTYCNACMVQTGVGGGGGEGYKLTSQDGEQTQNICIIFIQCWTNAEDVGPSLYKCYTNILCLLGRSVQNHSLKLYHHTAIASITARAIRHQNIKLPSFFGDM